MPEPKQWAPSRWSPERTRRFLRHARMHVVNLYSFADFPTSGVGEAVMSIEIALSKVRIQELGRFGTLSEIFQESTGVKELYGTRREPSSET